MAVSYDASIFQFRDNRILTMPEVHPQLSAPDTAHSLIGNTRIPNPVLMALRSATKNQHAIVDASMPLSNPDATWPDYVEHLHMLAAWLLPLENWLSGFSDGPQGEQAPELIRYTDLIRADLGENFVPDSKIWQNASPPLHTKNAAYRWGICYVIEGSQLGGEFLYKRLESRLAPHPLKYLQCKQTGRWPKFLATMAGQVITQDEINSACEGAVDAFDSLLLQLRAQEDIL